MHSQHLECQLHQDYFYCQTMCNSNNHVTKIGITENEALLKMKDQMGHFDITSL